MLSVRADAARGPAVRKGELAPGDHVVVRTRNSVYKLWARADGTFIVTGGWFDKMHDRPVRLGINGCTYGGRAIRHDVVAAPGLFLEFANNVCTTRIQRVEVFRARDAA